MTWLSPLARTHHYKNCDRDLILTFVVMSEQVCQSCFIISFYYFHFWWIYKMPFTVLTDMWRNRFHWFESFLKRLRITKKKLIFWSWNVVVFLHRSKQVGSTCTQMPIYFLPKWQNFYSIKTRKGSHFGNEESWLFVSNYELKVSVMHTVQVANCLSVVEIEHYIYH